MHRWGKIETSTQMVQRGGSETGSTHESTKAAAECLNWLWSNNNNTEHEHILSSAFPLKTFFFFFFSLTLLVWIKLCVDGGGRFRKQTTLNWLYPLNHIHTIGC